MKRLVAFAAIFAAVSFASCGNKPAESTETVAETKVEEVTPEVVEEEIIVEEEIAPADSTTVVEVAPAE